MDNGNCACCKDALHTKIRVEINPIIKFMPDGSPMRGIRRSVNVCGDCASTEDVAMEMAKDLPGAPKATPKAAPRK